MKGMFKKWEGNKIASRVCIALVAFALVFVSFAAAFAPAEAMAKKPCKKHKYGAERIIKTTKSTHTFRRNCTKCGKAKTVTRKHAWSSWKGRDNSSYHWKERRCYECNKYETKSKSKHTFNKKGKCTKCGRKNRTRA